MKSLAQISHDREDIYLEQTKDTLGQVSLLVANLATHQRSVDAGRLAAWLWLAKGAVESADASQFPRLHRRLPKLMSALELVCTWDEPAQPQHSSVLKELIQAKALACHAPSKAESRVKMGVLAFIKSQHIAKEQFFKKLKEFSAGVSTSADDHAQQSMTKPPSLPEYSHHVNASVYAMLECHSYCTCCSSNATQNHPTRLRLRETLDQADGYAGFDLLLASSPIRYDYWQDMQFSVSIKTQKETKKVMIQGEECDQDESMKVAESTERCQILRQGAICRLITEKLGSRIHCRIQGSELYQLYEASPIVQQADSGPSVSLRAILEGYRLSNRMKLVLAYILAHSVWQYYDSPWMSKEWTCDSIHFLPEPCPSHSGRGGTSIGSIYAYRPYLVVDFHEDERVCMEYCDQFSVIHRYPRILALCVLLLEIGTGVSIEPEEGLSAAAKLNAKWNSAKQLSNRDLAWRNFDYPDYRSAVLSCLDRKLFDGSSLMQDREELVNDVFERRAVLYQTVVKPLKRLLDVLGYSENFATMAAIDSRGYNKLAVNTPPQQPAVCSLPDHIYHSSSDNCELSLQWLDNLATINRYIYQLPFRNMDVPIRIAVLDTGYDCETVFFENVQQKRRIQGWKDWVEGSPTPTDDGKHGTHTLALLMKVAPMADFYVARVAKDRTNLANAGNSVAEAIVWAADDCKADVICMAFGFPSEVPAIGRALREAELRRDGRILFFAAASNSGGNQREMFPASHDSVISIRETNSFGAFSDTNPPIDHDGAAVFGTLGKDVPAAWPGSDGEVPKSGSSIATAVAAGVAAMALELAAIAIADPAVNLPDNAGMLWTRMGMRKLLRRMSQDMGHRMYFISPICFFESMNQSTIWAALADVVHNIR